MPQLMPLNWCFSFLLVMLLFIMMSLIYFEQNMNISVFEKNKEEIITIWKW